MDNSTKVPVDENMNKSSQIILILLLLSACRGPVVILPEGNVEALNSDENELAAAQKPLGAEKNIDPCFNEFHTKAQGKNHGIRPSRQFLTEMLGEKAAKRVDAITFMTERSGFFSIAHPPDETGAALLELPYSGIVGGTDIFEFDFVGGKYVFTNPGEPVNSATWDSHPFAAQTEDGTILLIWASDRADHLIGYGSPYLRQKRISILGDTLTGNSDLYYAFKTDTGWTYPRNFAETGGDISSAWNDQTPYIWCLCHDPVLLFASDRDSVRINDFDIYKAQLRIDFERFIIKQEGISRPVFRFRDSASANAKDFFPFVPRPYPDTDSAQPELFFSSDRYHKEFIKNQDTSVKNAGKYDFYSFPVDLECRPPKIKYIAEVKNGFYPDREIPEPFVQLRRANGSLVAVKDTSPAEFWLEAGMNYRAYGGSRYDRIECESSDSSLSHFAFMRITELDPAIVERKIAEKYDTTIAGELVIWYDTNFVEKSFHTSRMSEIKPEENRRIKSISYDNDTVYVTFEEVIRRDSVSGGRTITLEREVSVYDTIPRVDTAYIRTASEPMISKLSQKMAFPGYVPEADTVIRDEIYILPRYYYFPPCRWEYITHITDYRRNVPYFQTGFWEVNTEENLKRHLELLDSEKYDEASFIELHDKNQYFGYRRRGLDDEQKEYRKMKRSRRIAEYKSFAEAIDNNLQVIADEVTDVILPAFIELITKANEADNKLIIQIHSYSDMRPVKKGEYLGENQIRYISAYFDEENMKIHAREVEIPPGASLVGKDNETLSDLRAFFGYREVLNQLMKDEKFLRFMEEGLVLLPDEVSSEAEYEEKIDRARILFLIEGRQVDPKGTFEIPGYVGKEGDYSSLDPIRRINVIVNRIEYVDGRFRDSPCCSKRK